MAVGRTLSIWSTARSGRRWVAVSTRVTSSVMMSSPAGGVEQVDQGGFLPGELLLGIVLVLVALEAPAGAAEQQHAGDGGQ